MGGSFTWIDIDLFSGRVASASLPARYVVPVPHPGLPSAPFYRLATDRRSKEIAPTGYDTPELQSDFVSEHRPARHSEDLATIRPYLSDYEQRLHHAVDEKSLLFGDPKAIEPPVE